jgi:hypothetical protein
VEFIGTLSEVKIPVQIIVIRKHKHFKCICITIKCIVALPITSQLAFVIVNSALNFSSVFYLRIGTFSKDCRRCSPAVIKAWELPSKPLAEGHI